MINEKCLKIVIGAVGGCTVYNDPFFLKMSV